MKISFGMDCVFSTVLYHEQYYRLYNPANNIHAYDSSSFTGSCNSKPVIFPEINVDVKLFKGLKVTTGFFMNSIKFSTPLISGDSGWKWSNTPGGAGTHTFHLPAHKYQDNIRLLFIGNSIGLGYCLAKGKFMFDLDVGLKTMFLIDGHINRKYASGEGFRDYNNKIDLKDSSGYFTFWLFSYYLKASLSYKIFKNIYCNVGGSFANPFSNLKGERLSNNSSEYSSYFLTFRQFNILTGLTYVIK
ncbi:MAG: hypothetical protein ACXVC6_04450 [Bacteroidia bacterium]